MSALPDELLARLSGWATATYGLRFPPDRWHELGRGIASAALELGIADLHGWAEDIVAATPASEHHDAIAAHLTIAETYFFRHPDTFALLERELIPQRLAVRKQQRRALRVWSAGCASGEEPYSLAILLRHRFGELAWARPQIAGTDLNPHVLARARAGVYTDWSFRDTPDWVRSSYFRKVGAHRWALAPEIRDMVHFAALNLAAPLYPAEFGAKGDFDFVFCRNVLMYFSADWQETIVGRLAQAVAPGGWLIVGPCDVPTAQGPALGLVAHAPGLFQKDHEMAERIDSPNFLLPIPVPIPPVATAPTPPALTPPAGATSAPEPTVAPTVSGSEVASARAAELADRGELDAALSAVEEAIASDKTNPDFHYLRGCILLEQGRAAEAETAFRRVLFLAPNSIQALFALGSLAHRQGRPDEARRQFTLILRALDGRNRGEVLAGTAGLTVGRMQSLVENNLSGDERA